FCLRRSVRTGIEQLVEDPGHTVGRQLGGIINMELEHAVEHEHPQLGFWRKYVFSTDHKIIGLQYLITAMAMACIGGILSMFMRLQLAWPAEYWPTLGKIMPNAFNGGTVMDPAFYVSLVTMHGTIMV